MQLCAEWARPVARQWATPAPSVGPYWGCDDGAGTIAKRRTIVHCVRVRRVPVGGMCGAGVACPVTRTTIAHSSEQRVGGCSIVPMEVDFKREHTAFILTVKSSTEARNV